MPSPSRYGSPVSPGSFVATPHIRKAVTFSSCYGRRSSRSATTTFVSKRTGMDAESTEVTRSSSRRDRSRVLYVSCMTERVTAWRPGVPLVQEVLHATFAEHAYPAHTHDAWTVLSI